MSKKLFIGGLSWDTSERELEDAFIKFGTIETLKIVMDRDSGRSKGFGFITFAQDQDAITAVSQMDGSKLAGRTLKVNEALEQTGRGGGRPPRGENFGNR